MKLLCDPCKLVGLLDHASVTWIQVFIIVGKWRIWVSHKILYFNTRVGVLTLINDSLRIFSKKTPWLTTSYSIFTCWEWRIYISLRKIGASQNIFHSFFYKFYLGSVYLDSDVTSLTLIGWTF